MCSDVQVDNMTDVREGALPPSHSGGRQESSVVRFRVCSHLLICPTVSLIKDKGNGSNSRGVSQLPPCGPLLALHLYVF